MIYLDHAATTAVAPQALEEMLPYFCGQYGNPSTMYSLGTGSKKAVNEAKRRLAGMLGAEMEEIYFTSGGTESDNWAIRGVAEGYAHKGRHIITTRIEHHGVLHPCEYLEKQGYRVTYLPVDSGGMISTEDLEAAICPDTILISVMFANNEVGTIQPIKEIGALAREKGILFHTDAVQAFGHLDINVQELGIDLLSASGHKINGPKGIGFLYVNKTVKLPALLRGGAQERGLRAGTENVPGIVGMAVAAGLWQDNRKKRQEHEKELQEYLFRRLTEEIPHCLVNGDRCRRLPGNVHVSFPGIEGESLLIMLDMKGICASSGSACTTGARKPSHVLLAMGLTEQEARGSLRLTLSWENTREELDEAVEAIKEIVGRLRTMSPDYSCYMKSLEKG
ncbi:MAG: cysteine desulfurase NifS [Lachnospiraceae bacterium]|nr:cysteine desulfurase NifS [Lachnospiraceae bacterium]